MDAELTIVLLLTVTTPIAWFASEFQNRIWLRLILGCAAIFLCFGVAFVVGSLEMFNANAWFGGATQDLVNTAVEQMEAGKTEQVLAALKNLQKTYQPTYENRARYDKLVETAVQDMK